MNDLDGLVMDIGDDALHHNNVDNCELNTNVEDDGDGDTDTDGNKDEFEYDSD